jgi:RNA polymerase sigma-70 factor (ECF subfamily)
VSDSGHEEEQFRREQQDFESLFRAHYPEIVRYLAVRVGSREEATDLASDVFVEALRGVPLLRWRGRPVRAWLYRVASNMAADAVKRRAREVQVETPGTHRVSTDAGPEAVVDRTALRAALGALPPQYQLVVHLRLVEGLSFTEVGRAMGRSPAACQMLLLRAARALREQMRAEGFDG